MLSIIQGNIYGTILQRSFSGSEKNRNKHIDPSYTSKDGPPDRSRFPNMENIK